MALKVLVLLLSMACISTGWSSDESVFYKAYTTKSIETIDNAINELSSKKGVAILYVAALKAKKSGLISSISEKMKLFKEGVNMIEEFVKRNPDNAEYRFIRFTIQDNAPPIVNYKSNIEEDLKVIYSKYNSLRGSLKDFIYNYSHSSEHLEKSKLK